MNRFKLEQLQQSAINSVYSCLSEANELSSAYRIGDLHSLHISAHMNIDNTTDSLKSILGLKKEASTQMLKCSNAQMCEQLACVIRNADDMIMKLLGIQK